MNNIKKYLINGLLDVRNTIILGVILTYFCFIVFPVVVIAVIITYVIGTILELDWRHLKKIPKKIDEVMDGIVTTLD